MSFPLPYLSIYPTPVPQISPVDAGPLRPISRLLNLHQGSAKFFTRREGFPDFSNRLRGFPNNLQPMPGISDRHRGWSGSVWNIGSWPPPTRSSEALAIWTVEILVACSYGCTAHAHFSVKINFTLYLTLFVLVPRLTLRINSGYNYLNMTVFSQYGSNYSRKTNSLNKSK